MPITKRSLSWSNGKYWYETKDERNTYIKEVSQAAAETLEKRFGLRIVYRVRHGGVQVRVTREQALGGANTAAVRARVAAAVAKKQRPPPAKKPATTKPWAQHHALPVARIHDNGGVPWMVFHDESQAHVYRQEPYKVPILKRNYRELVASFAVQRMFAPDRRYRHAGERVHDVGTVLLQQHDGTWVFVGRQLFAFCCDEWIESFHSPLGNNDVPYPYALGREYVYLMLDGVRVRRSAFPAQTAFDKDVYGDWYQLTSTAKKKKQQVLAEPIADWRALKVASTSTS